MTVLKVLPRGVRHPAWGNLIDADLWPNETVRPGRAATFAANYLDLVENGYEVVAIRPGEKRPTLDSWACGHPPEQYLTAGQGGWGTGILCRSAPGLDLDVRHRQLVRLLIEMADAMIGRAPVRFGARPKALLAYRTDNPFAKVTNHWFALPDEDFGAEGYKPNRVEILAAGQQYVSHARHPNGFFYRWTRGDPLAIPRTDLPVIDQDKAQRFAAEADNVFYAAGGIHVEHGPDKRWRRVEPKSRRRSSRRRTKSRRAASDWKSLPLAEIARKIDPHGRERGWGWHLRCPAHDDSTPSMTLTEKDGTLYWRCFSGCSGVEVARAIEDLV